MAKLSYFRHTSGSILSTESPQYWRTDANYTALSAAEGERLYEAQAADQLREMLKPGQTVYTILRHVSASGMSRRISLVVIEDGEPRDITYLASTVIGWKLAKKGSGIQVSGCGMDMGFHLVYTLGACLWPEGTPEPHGMRNGEPDRAGGYALKQYWL